MDIFSTGSVPGSIEATIAWPTSWYATRSFSSCFMSRFFFSRPATDPLDGLVEVFLIDGVLAVTSR